MSLSDDPIRQMRQRLVAGGHQRTLELVELRDRTHSPQAKRVLDFTIACIQTLIHAHQRSLDEQGESPAPTAASAPEPTNQPPSSATT